jgi:hypothetical protein
MKRALVLSSCVLLVACVDGGQQAPAVTPMSASSGSGSSVSPPAVPFVAIQPEDARVVMAAHAVTGRIGHDVNFDVDAELLKEHASHLSIIVADALETVARGIDRARADTPVPTMRTLSTLAALQIKLDEKARDPYAYVDPDAGALVLVVPTNATSFTTDALVAAALSAEH